MNQLRLYTFVNFYLSSIQQGIQSAHVISELVYKYRGSRSAASKLLNEWNDDGKTMIVLNGGTAGMVADQFGAVVDYVGEPGSYPPRNVKGVKYPFAAFYEERGAVGHDNEAMTAWGVVLPPEVYNAKPHEVFPSRTGFLAPEAEGTEPQFYEEGSFEHLLCSLLQGKGLAR